MFSPVYFKRLNLRAFSEQFPLILRWVELLGFDVVVNFSQNTPSHYALRKFWGEHCISPSPGFHICEGIWNLCQAISLLSNELAKFNNCTNFPLALIGLLLESYYHIQKIFHDVMDYHGNGMQPHPLFNNVVGVVLCSAVCYGSCE